jgi:hypothetical protein
LADALDVWTVYRMRYEMPPNDERFLAITEEEVLRDLLVIKYNREKVDDLLHPSSAEHGDPEAAARYERERVALLSDPKFMASIARVARPRGTTDEPKKIQIRFRRRD